MIFKRSKRRRVLKQCQRRSSSRHLTINKTEHSFEQNAVDCCKSIRVKSTICISFETEREKKSVTFLSLLARRSPFDASHSNLFCWANHLMYLCIKSFPNSLTFLTKPFSLISAIRFSLLKKLYVTRKPLKIFGDGNESWEWHCAICVSVNYLIAKKASTIKAALAIHWKRTFSDKWNMTPGLLVA